MTVQILKGDCREVLRSLPDESVHCVVTSPPYWGLRAYGGDAGMIGLETSIGEHMKALVEVFREVRRVLRTDGVMWVNYGDAYNAGTSAGRRAPASGVDVGGWLSSDSEVDGGARVNASELKPKDLIGLPWRLAFALQADGWWLRADVVWAKPNPMPESCTDRPTKAHEYIFLLTKASRYWYDADAIRTPLQPKTFTTFGTDHRAQGNDALGGNKSDNWGRTVAKRQPKVKVPGGWDRGEGAHGTVHRDGRGEPEYQKIELAGANARSVWTIATEGFPEAHFATFPTKLAETCILAGCPARGMVLDPFGGAGTVGMVADRLSRDAILIELNPEYAAMAERRIKGDAGMFASVHS